MDKLIWYYATPDEEEYKLYLSQYEGARDFYMNKGYDVQLKHDFDGKMYRVHLEVYDFEAKESKNADKGSDCPVCG